jgi:hypothetical protein
VYNIFLAMKTCTVIGLNLFIHPTLGYPCLPFSV